MGFQADNIVPSGGLNQDLDLSLIPRGDYTSALNIQHITDAGGTSYAIQNTKGNLLRFAIPATTVQNKIYRVTLGADGVTSHTLTFRTTDGTILGAPSYTEGASIAASRTALLAAINGDPYVLAQVPLYTSSGTTDELIELTLVTGYEWTLTSDDFTNPTVTQEAWSDSLTGEANIIGSYDLLGDLFIWSTTRTELPTVFGSIISTADNGSGLIRVFVLDTTGLITGQSVSISGSSNNTNGTWIITVVDGTHFDLLNSTFSATATGTITINVQGIGEIGVAVYDPNTDITTYTTLIKSKEFNFTTAKQIDTYCEENNFRRSIYWTDDYSVPRVLYYSGVYVTNGAIEVINPDGEYAYGSIVDETNLVLTNELIGFTFIQQLQAGGAVKSGNWRYSVRLLTETFSATNWTDLSNPINVFVPSTLASALLIQGNDENTTTSKINEFTVSNIPVGVFKYIELAGVNYLDTAIAGYNIKRIVIASDTMTIQHTGNEVVSNLDLATLNQSSFSIKTAKNIDAIDNRLILSNLTTSQSVDFSAWTESWTHSLFKKSINGVRYSNDGSFRLGEYADPDNVSNYTGYMYNETYRFFAKLVLIDGTITNSFWIDDIKFDTTTPARRNNTLSDYDMTNVAGTIVYVPAVTFETINFDFLVGGVRVRDLVASIHIERVECVPEVLASGIAVLTIKDNLGLSAFVVQPDTSVDFSSGYYSTATPAVQKYGEWIPYYTDSGSNATPNIYGYIPTTTKKNDYFSLYSPDILYGKTSYTYNSGDQVISFSQAGPAQAYVNFSNGADHYRSVYLELTGEFNAAAIQTVNVSAATNISGSSEATVGGLLYSKTLWLDANTNNDSWYNIGTPVFQVATPLTSPPVSGKADIAYYNVQVFRPKVDKYGDKTTNKTIPTGAIYNVTSASPAILPIGGGIITYGGDVFTQKSYVKNRLQLTGTSFARLGFIQGFSFYSQNRVNVQMTKRSSTQWSYPVSALAFWLDSFSSFAPPDYNRGYTIQNGISVNAAFDENLPDQSDLPTEIRWSDLKPQNAVVDNFRVFLPLNFKDLPASWGEIIDQINFNGELFTLQPRMLQRQYFNTRGTMNVGGQTPTQVLIGDGSVMSRDGQMVTGIGTYHKWSVIKGKSAQGNDTLYWINTELKKVMRMGYDGTISIADIHGMQSFFANNLKWVVGKDTPADGQGICGVWDDRYMAAIWTVRGIRDVGAWDEFAAYEEGDTAAYVPEEFSTFNETGEIYRALENIAAGVVAVNPDPIVWDIVGGPTNESYIIDFSHNVTIGFANWNTDLDTTMADVADSLNTNTNPDPGNPIWGGIPAFDNSLGYTCAWDIALQKFTVSAPIGVYASGNAINLFFAYNGGAGLTITPDQSQLYSGGVDPVSNDNPVDNEAWELVEHTDNNYYNEYTIEFNEQKNKFTTFYSFLPKIYLKWTDTFLTPRPISDTGEVYEHRLGDYCVWYDDGETSLTEDGNIELIYNQQINASKMYNALWLYSLLVPARIDLYTNRHQSFLLAADAENQLDYYTLPVKNDILTSSNGQLNDEDTSGLFGEYLKVKITFTAGVFQKIVDIVVKFFSQTRQSNK